MPKREYDWSGGPAELQPHSLAKHTILREYIAQYIKIYTKDVRVRSLNIVLIDGFAGGGEYHLPGESLIRPGSPVIMIDAVNAATFEVNKDRRKPLELNAHFVFVEREPSALSFLKSVLSKRYDKQFLDEHVHLIPGAFEDHLPGILGRIELGLKPQPRPIFVLDQYGYANVPIQMIQEITRRLPRSEIFLTLATEHISAYESTLSGALSRLKRSMSIDVDASRPYLMGDRPIEALDAESPAARAEIMLIIQRVLHDTFATNAGARYYTPFFITSSVSRRSYWFLHLANKWRANDVVKELHWSVSNHFRHFGRAGTDMLMLGYDPLRELSNQQLTFDFAFDASAESLVEDALREELPRIVRERFPSGVSLEDLYDDLCNATPATRRILGASLNELCASGELEKHGSDGETRAFSTTLKDSDIVRASSQTRLFSFADLMKTRKKP